MTDADFQLKGSTITAVVIELHHYQHVNFPVQLQEKIQQAPQLFDNSPVVISLEKLSGPVSAVDLRMLVTQCRDLGLQPLGFRGASEDLAEVVTATGLSVLPQLGARSRAVGLDLPEPAVQNNPETQPVAEAAVEEEAQYRPSKVITRPIRSGQQVYAKGADLIVLSQVSEGAEVLADGHIHIYGALRGKALAGVHGDASARIFCQLLDPELISVAGNFLLSESLDDNIRKQSAQIYLDGEALKVIPI